MFDEVFIPESVRRINRMFIPKSVQIIKSIRMGPEPPEAGSAYDDNRSNCFVATAVVEARGLPGNCSDLTVLRTFRDEYIKSLPGGKLIVRAYYQIGPRIVAGINKTSNPKKIYSELYDRLVLKSVEMIRAGKKRQAFMHGLKIMAKLCPKYLFKR